MRLRGRKNNNSSKIILCIAVISLLFIGIGYSYITSNFYVKSNISFSSNVKAKQYINVLGKDTIAYLDNIASENVPNATGINFAAAPSDSNGNGLYLLSGTENDPYPIYYYRGNVTNNHVLFGGFCWRVVRTTEKGGTKLIYDGKPSEKNECNNTGSASVLSSGSPFNTSADSLTAVGYMYGTKFQTTSWADTSYIYGSDVTYSNSKYTLTNTNAAADTLKNVKTKHYTCKLTTNGTCSTVYYVYSFYNNNAYAISLTGGKKLANIINESNTNTNDSAIKKVIDTWFKENLLSYKSKLEDAVWCNDRSIVNSVFLQNEDVTTDSLGRSYFGALKSRNLYSTALTPGIKDSMACPNKNDRFTVSDTENGNGALTYPVGLLTADEVTIAGHGVYGYSTSSFLYNSTSYWTMSPCFIASHGYNGGVFNIGWSGFVDNNYVNTNYNVRPSIVLKAGIAVSSGDGTVTNPYVIN